MSEVCTMICGLSVNIVIIKQVKSVILKDTYNLNMKEGCTTDVTNVVIQHVISRNLTNTFRKMYTKMAGMSSTVMNVTLKQPRHILSNPTWQPSMMENAFSVINVITRVPQSNH